MGMLNSKLQKFMWQIRTASGSVKKVFKDSSILLHLTLMKVQINSFAYRLDV
jgi:hypothetical protein